MGKKEKQGRIKSLLKDRNIDIVCFQETKRAVISDVDARRLWGSKNMEFMSVDPEGIAGGLLCIWDPAVFTLSGCCCHRRASFWDNILKLKTSFPNPWCMAGDFNEIGHINERVGCSRRDRGMKHLNDFIGNSELHDLPLHGRKYTWCNAHESEKWSRIDRVLLSSEWLINFPMKLWGLPRLISDHCPLLMMEDVRDWGPKPFKFLNAWTLHPSFSQLFVSSWLGNTIAGWSGYILSQS
ncbi:uncharacterized protein LOC114308363 [Camellia sinensis]|uniref:uncharacterized protein LOC114308363 n=1 Tax=Camellia sinensis TaxID=4442 RepID=UPI001036A03C|nr:uncharacterized protein LOC114308363 [Camellia sinensis]